MDKKIWDAEKYQSNFDFVPMYGMDVINLVEIAAGQKVLDIGCGNGTLTKQIMDKGAIVTGIDFSDEMVALARKNYPGLNAYQMDASEMEFHEQFDIIFSNAVFHWIKNQDKLISAFANALKPKGQLVCEFGGVGCGQMVHGELTTAFKKRNYSYNMPFYFPSIGEYSPKLEAHGLRVIYSVLFDRPTTVQGESGLRDWINMFITQPFEGISQEIKNEIIDEVEKQLKSTMYNDNQWLIDYVRIRFKAVKI